MNKFLYLYGNLNFRKKINITYFVTSLIPILLLGFFSYSQAKYSLVTQEKQNLEITLDQISTNVDHNLETYNNVSNFIAFNNSIQTSLEKDYHSNYYAMGETYDNLIDPIVSSIKSLNPSIKELTLYTDSNISEHGNILKNINRVYNKNWYPIVVSDYNIHWFIEDNNTLACIRRISAYPYYQTITRTLVYVDVGIESVFNTLQASLGDNYGVAVINSRNDIIYSKDSFTEHYSYLKLSKSQLLEFNQNPSDSSLLKNYTIKSCSLKYSDWNIIIYKPIIVISSSTTSILSTLFAIIITCISILIIVEFYLSRVIVNPIEKLTKSMNEVKSGNMNIHISSPYTDELGVLTNTFQDMVNQIDFLFKEVYQNKILQQKLRLKALQAQINPHFLYNSLSLINWKAIIAEQHEISKMSLLLSTFYRTSLNKGKNTTSMRDEIENTKSYIEIQLMLHNNKFNVEYNIDENILNYSILNLTLQPLVENSIVHGLDLKESDDKKLIVSASLLKELDIIELCIQDNGVGINEAILPNLLNMQTKGYGLKNVNDRIQLYFGDSFGLSIQSAECVGTSITIRIPAIPIESSNQNSLY
nr:histidine kinase [Clostridium chromiireducens]